MQQPEGSRAGRFIALSFLWSWAFWIPLVTILTLGGKGATTTGIPPWAHALALVGGYGPSLAALAVTGATGGGAAVRALVRRMVLWRVGVAPHVAAWLLPIVAASAARLLFLGAGGSLPGPTADRLVFILPAIVLAVPFGPLGEELGWRGFLLPELEKRHGSLLASALVGIVWTAWHFPLFWAPAGTSISGGPVTVLAVVTYLARVMGWSFLFTWLTKISRGSILLPIAMHTSLNADILRFFIPRLPAEVARDLDLLTALPVAIMAAVVMVLMREQGRRQGNGDERPRG